MKVTPMRYVTFATIGPLGIAAISALAQAPPVDPATGPQPGRDYNQSRDSEQHSNQSSNIVPANTRSDIAPTLPMPRIGQNATFLEYLKSACESLAQGRTGQAQQSLEMAETRALSRSVPQEQTDKSSGDKLVLQISSALRALGTGNRTLAMQIIDSALAP